MEAPLAGFVLAIVLMVAIPIRGGPVGAAVLIAVAAGR
jgi:hypothetical protein